MLLKLNASLRVYQGDLKGTLGTVIRKNKKTLTLTLKVDDGSQIKVKENECIYVKKGKMKRKQGERNSKYTKSTETSEERYKRVTEKRENNKQLVCVTPIFQPLRVYLASLLFDVSNASMKMTCSRGDIAIYRGSVLDLAIKDRLPLHIPNNFVIYTCIGNATNTGMLGGGGLDGQIGIQGGSALLAARKNVPIIQGTRDRCRVGDAKATIAGDIKVDYVVHAVGPNFNWYEDFSKAYVDLYTAYYRMFQEAYLNKCIFIGVPLLSASIFRANAPLDSVIAVGLLAAMAFLKHHSLYIYFAAFSDDEQTCIMALLHQLLPLANSDNISDFDSFFEVPLFRFGNWLEGPLQRIFSHSFEHGDLLVNSPGQLMGAASAVHQ